MEGKFVGRLDPESGTLKTALEVAPILEALAKLSDQVKSEERMGSCGFLLIKSESCWVKINLASRGVSPLAVFVFRSLSRTSDHI